MDWVVEAGLIELALGGLLGWAMVMREERPELLRRIGIVAPQRIRQVHLDYVMMGLILIAVGLAVPDLPTGVAVALVFGTAVNPFLFVPLAFDPEVEKQLWYRLLAVVSFICVSSGLVVAAVVGPSI
jgi:hydroxylaminobenzene mutase